jgi:hypothetical protein
MRKPFKFLRLNYFGYAEAEELRINLKGES